MAFKSREMAVQTAFRVAWPVCGLFPFWLRFSRKYRLQGSLQGAVDWCLL